MRRFLIYTKLQIKKAMRTYPAMLFMTLLLTLVLGTMLYVQTRDAADTMTGKEDARVKIGITGTDSSPYLKLGLSMLENMDPSKVAVSFSEYGQEEALKLLKSGDLSAVISLPDGMTDKLLSGNTDVKIGLTVPDAGGIGPLLIRELSSCISLMIGEMESSSFALSDFYQESGVTDPEDISDAQTDLLYMTLKKVLQRNHLFKVSRVQTDATLTIESYYLCAMYLLLALLIGVMLAGNYIRTDRSLDTLLRIRGFSTRRQVMAEYLSLLAFMILLGAIFIPATGLALTGMPIVFSELRSQTPFFIRSYFIFILKSAPVVLMAGALDILLYELADSLISGVLLQFLVATALAYLSGLFYPLSSLPEAIQRIAPYLPTGSAMFYLRKSLLRGRSVGSETLVLLAYSVAFLLLAADLRRRKITKVRR